MKAFCLTRQRLRSNTAFISTMTDEELLDRVRIRASEDGHPLGDSGWVVTDVEILARFPDPDNKPVHHNQLDRVVALITEVKSAQVPETTEEYRGWP